MLPSTVSVAIPRHPVADWATVGTRLMEVRQAAGLERHELARQAGVDAADLARQEHGEPVLDAFDLQALARVLSTTTGAWFYADEAAMFRGIADRRAADEAEALGRTMMSRFLATEALCI